MDRICQAGRGLRSSRKRSRRWASLLAEGDRLITVDVGDIWCTRDGGYFFGLLLVSGINGAAGWPIGSPGERRAKIDLTPVPRFPPGGKELGLSTHAPKF